MLMMKIEMNADKIQAEQRYTISAINRTIESAFAQMQLHKVEDASGALLYRDSGNARDYGRFWQGCQHFEKAAVVYGQRFCLAFVRQ